MKPIELDLLLAKIRKQDKLLERLGSDLERAMKRIEALEMVKSVHLEVDTDNVTAPNEFLVWTPSIKNKSASDNFVVNEGGTIQFKVAETYAIHLDVLYENTDSEGGVCEIHIGNETVQWFYGPKDNSEGSILDAMCLLEVAAGELMSVVNTSNDGIEDSAIMSIFLV